MRLTLAGVLPFALSLLVSRGARAEEGPPPVSDEAPGAAATPPEAPADVPPPESTPSSSDAPGTSSAGVVQAEPESKHGGHGGGRIVYRNGRLLYRDASGLLELAPSGLLHFDFYAFGGPGVPDYQRSDGTGLKANLAARRVRLEIGGRIAKRWYFLASLQSTNGGTVVPLNNFVGVDVAPMLKLQVGQFRIPFGMDNTTAIRWGEFMERTLGTHALTAPLIRDLGIMAWGGTDRSAIFWSLAYLGGEGQNRPSVDNRGDVVGRVIFRPLWASRGSISQLHFGLSGRYGRRDRTYVHYDAPAMSTPGGYVFWSPSYGSGAGETHVLPSNDQSAVGAELFLPIDRFDLRGEIVGVHDDRREVFAATRGTTERAGTMSGLDWYVQASYWLFGPPRMVGAPGVFVPSVDEHAHARAMSIAARFEQLRVKYDSIERSYRDDGSLVPGVRRGAIDASTTDLRVNVVQLAATYWATRQIRLSAQWSLYHFPGTPGVSNQATAPGSKPNNDLDARADANVLHEFAMRLQVSF